MKRVTTLRDKIREVSKSWNAQYKNNSDPEKVEICRRLSALDLEVVDPKVINDIIGNNSWTRFECDECKEDQTVLRECGQISTYERNTLMLCLDCLSDGVKQIMGNQ